MLAESDYYACFFHVADQSTTSASGYFSFFIVSAMEEGKNNNQNCVRNGEK